MRRNINIITKTILLVFFYVLIFNSFFILAQDHQKVQKILLVLNNGKKIGPYEGVFLSHDSRGNSPKYLYYYHKGPEPDTNTTLYNIPIVKIKEILNIKPYEEPFGHLFFWKADLILNDGSLSQVYFWYQDGFKVKNNNKKHQQLIYITDISSVMIFYN
jgi:hypothetical protein